jgi:hypothetical protein
MFYLRLFFLNDKKTRLYCFSIRRVFGYRVNNPLVISFRRNGRTAL